MSWSRRILKWAGAVSIAAAFAQAAETNAPVPLPPEPAPASPRDFYNAGTRQLTAGKLKEAEALLESALASQNERVQQPAIYNLGQARAALGTEQLKKGPQARPAARQGNAAAESAEEAIRGANESLASNQVQKMVESYMQGRGARKELRAAMKAVKKALEVYGAALTKWQRASADFKSAAELNPADANARHNAEAMDRNIAALIDSMRELEEAAKKMGQKKEDLGAKMKELRGRIPDPEMPPGAAGEDEEEEDMPKGPMDGKEEGPTRDGQEQTPVSEEQAGWILEGFQLDQGRRLPMGQGETSDPKARNRPTW